LPVGLDLPEILVILILALVLFGPEKLPEYGAKLGRLVARLRQAGAEVTQPLQQALNQELLPPTTPPPPRFGANFCPHCGHALEPDFTFCPRCGRRQEKGGASPQTLAS
jgi:sec-independent protein translocase protein TatA